MTFEPSLGTCCNCGCDGENVRNIVMLGLRSPEPGNGCWGCLVCDLPSAGAVAVLCDKCIEAGEAPQRACLGYPDQNRRIPLSELTERFQHDDSKHPEVMVGSEVVN